MMSKSAIIVVGRVWDKKKLIDELHEVLKKKESFSFHTSAVFMMVDVSENIEHLEEELNCEINIIKLNPSYHDHVFIDALYKLKTELDCIDAVDCLFFLSSAYEQLFLDMCSWLFPGSVYNFAQNMHGSTNLTPFYTHVKLTKLSDVEDYLRSICSEDGGPVCLLSSPLIPESFVHGYSSRQGGVSTHPGLASLNLCCSKKKKDSKLVVNENRARLAQAANFNPKDLHIAKAVHGKDVWVYEEHQPESYDAIITNTSGICVAAPGADCNMLLFADPVTASCGAAHAGWKGILCGVIQATVKAMIKKYGTDPRNLIVAIGPSLSACCCEFGVEGSKDFEKIDKRCVMWKPGCKKPFLDLRLAAKVLLMQCGVPKDNIDDGSKSNLQICTKCDPEHRYFSFRRIGLQFGNQVGLIGLPLE